MQRIARLAEYSAATPGVTRLAYTPEMRQATAQVAQWMTQAGMTTRVDMAGNLIGRYAPNHDDQPSLMIGSHLDSVVQGGRYDGILGVIAAIEVVSHLSNNGMRLAHPIEVVAFMDEEGARFHTAMIGSRAMAGLFDPSELHYRDANGITLDQALAQYGLDGAQLPQARRDPGSLAAYLELHIEQGTVLEQANQPVGIVTGIIAEHRYEFKVQGQSGHAGGVPMTNRRDALMGTAEVLQIIETEVQTQPEMVGTVGQLAIHPGNSNVIPGLVVGTLDLRAPDETTLTAVMDRIRIQVQDVMNRRGLFWHEKLITRLPGMRCTPTWQHLMAEIFQAHGLSPLKLISRAGHDAMALAHITDVGMLFVRCQNGISHHPDEAVDPCDIQIALQLLSDIVCQWDRKHPEYLPIRSEAVDD